MTICAATFLAGLLLAVPVQAQDLLGQNGAEQPPPTVQPIDRAEIAARAEAVEAELTDATAALAGAQAEGPKAQLEARLDALRSIKSLLREQLDLAERLADENVAEGRLPAEEPPSAVALDELLEAQFASEEAERQKTEDLASSRETLAAAKKKLDSAEKKRREARAELDGAPDAGAKASAERKLETRQLASRTARERVHLQTLRVRLAERALDEGEPDTKLAERIAQMREDLARGAGQATGEDPEHSRRESALRLARASSQRALASAELRVDAAQKRFARETLPSAQSLEEIEALTAYRDSIREQIELIDAQLERLAVQRTIWRHWDALLGGTPSREELDAWKAAAVERSEALEIASQLRRSNGEDLEGRISALTARLRELPETAPLRSTLTEQRDALEQQLEAERAELAELARDQRRSARMLADLRQRTGEIDPLEYALRAAKSARELWGYEITAVDDSAITVGSLMLALMFAGVGVWISRRGSALLGRIAGKRLRLDPGAVNALETLSFYVLLVSFTMLALRAVHFPLTAFTVLGGALAIGIGFGSQNVMNNFISGLILMLERPVRARDNVEVDDNQGVIERIGARSTLIRSNDGRHIIVPNSFFLESNVINWTLSDELIRTSVLVGVEYGSPTRLVEELIHRAVDEEELVLEKPKPLVLFEEFGDNSLNFEVHFWVRARSRLQVHIVQSKVRFRIDDLFRENALVIAFPQRDVHLDSSSPLEVRVLPGQEPSESHQAPAGPVRRS